MVGDQQRPAVGGDLLQALPLDPEPVAVHRVVQAADDGAHVLRPPPLVDVGAAGVLGSASAVPAGGWRRAGRRRWPRSARDARDRLGRPAGRTRRRCVVHDGLDEVGVVRVVGGTRRPDSGPESPSVRAHRQDRTPVRRGPILSRTGRRARWTSSRPANGPRPTRSSSDERPRVTSAGARRVAQDGRGPGRHRPGRPGRAARSRPGRRGPPGPGACRGPVEEQARPGGRGRSTGGPPVRGDRRGAGTGGPASRPRRDR